MGYVTTGTYSPEFNAGIGYVRFNLSEDHIGKNYYIGNLDSSKHTCKIIALPFYDKNKKKSKMAKLDLQESITLDITNKTGMN